ncbi:trifunctional serine/threonine-protein kinase/ATP-binding protein/sensor histidine kinase [Phormidium yuhuli AB48]|uniref:histidine kinase n=1 Tax=Phormidium yuhuli AB48 TaxID=2940671 RepID=A0ABY5AJV4_9CYAN|nr:ATP-binding sensor histidine kinase [Phormidium yuhuli]USR89464.1 trifunctional serine/threonine-protein kinase/ATP-binding protein/sensor histidine kinase [Phormidium yuhuli AB48]
MKPQVTTSSNTFPSIDGYSVTEQLYSGSRTAVYRAIQEAQGYPVVIKVLQREYPSVGELVQFRNQYAITKGLRIPGIAKPLGLDPYGNGYALVMEDSGSLSLSQYLENQVLSLEETLEIALELAKILQPLHQQRIIHKDIKPANILIAPNSGKITLIDFSIASRLPKEIQAIQSPQGLEGTLAYLAPEQTGRMNRGIDYRSDFYALGVTLYHLLTGQLPFPGDDPLEVIHSHIAKTPTPVPEVNPEVPAQLGAIVAKLMAKNAEDRYQSALGLEYDLAQCLNQWQETGTIAPFKLGQRDVSERFLIPEKLYGRETEVAQLLNAFERVAQGASELMLVAGFSGIGKTAVINEVHKPIVRQRGYFIKGKFDQFNRNIPLSAFVQAFNDLVGQLLSESDQQLQTWKYQLLEVLGDSGQVLIDLIPELERIIGPQPPAPELSGDAAQNRFNLLFQGFIKVFSTSDHPLVIFIDDLQWADSASLSLMERLLIETQESYLLVLGAYRDNEVSPGHPFLMTVKALETADVTLETLILGPLKVDSLNRLIADAFQAPEKMVQPLTNLVMQKTQGNPFFATQFLKALYQESLITFDHKAHHWQCDLVRVQDAALTDDVVKFMALQLQKLPATTQEQLTFAACIGARFDLKTLKIVSEQDQTQVASALWPALHEGLIVPESKIYKFYLDDDQPNDSHSVDDEISEQIHYRFFHDRVQQAAYSLILDSEKEQAHYRIATLLQRNTSEKEQEEALFEILSHLNLSRALVVDPLKRIELSRLNLRAAHKAKAATAYGAAIEYLKVGIEVLPQECWQQEYDLTLALHNTMVEAQYLSTNFEEMEDWGQIVLQEAKSFLDRIEVQKCQILAAKAKNKMRSALMTGLTVLKQLSVEFPDQPTEADIGSAMTQTAQLWAGKSPLELINLPEMVDTHRLAAMKIMTELIPCAYQTNPPLLPLLVCKEVEFSIRFGNCPVSTFAYADYGVVLCGILGEIEAGYEFGQLAIAVIDKFQENGYRCRAGCVINSLIRPWKDPLSDLLQPFLNAYTIGLETGDLESGTLNLYYYCLSYYVVGQDLATLVTEFEIYRKVIRSFGQLGWLGYTDMLQQLAMNLQGVTDVPWELQGSVYQAEAFLTQATSVGDNCGIFQHYLHSIYLLYLFNQTSEAAENLKIIENHLDGALSSFLMVFYVFFDALTQLALYPDISLEEQPKVLARVQQQQEQLQNWAAFAPANHQHRWELVEAERCRVVGDRARAIDYYDRAIATARTYKFTQDEALANERAARFYLDWGKEKVAGVYMQEAYYGYARWGANAKVTNLEQDYPELLRPILQAPVMSTEVLNTLVTIGNPLISSYSQSQPGSSSSSLNQALDLGSVLKASQALSGTLELDELLSQLTQIILQNSGGDRCTLIIPTDAGEWQVRAITTLETVHLCSEAIAHSPNLPLKLIQYVKNTQEVVTIDNLVTDLPVLDQYLETEKPKSVLGLPILTQGRCLGILYLQNQLSSGVFTPERITILNFLCTQAAISLENARLYQRVQQSLTELQEAQLQLVQSEKMSALGGLVSGVAHEINNPVGCILGNVGATEDYVQDLLGLLDLYGEAFPEPGEEIEAELEAVELDYVRQDLPQLIRAMRDSGDRIKSISKSLRTFSRKDTDSKQPFDIHEGLDSTLLILRHRLKANEHRPEIEVLKDYGSLQPVHCFPGQLNQVFMNLLANAIDVFDEMAQESSFAALKEKKQRITLTTRQVDNEVTLTIADNGSGIPEEIQPQIFDHLFTTKAVGKGTGLGLAIARQIVVDQHGGHLEVQSHLGQGTEFCIRLPR